MIRHLDLFAGMGGFSLAASWTGVVEPAGFCELDPWCQRVLAKHWPGVPIHDDITTLTAADLDRFGRIDLVTGGFPCQPFSVAGKRAGASDDRALWPAMAAVIAECRPTYVLGENVPGIVSMELDVCLADLGALGYACRAVVVPAVGIDAPHRRERVWILAHHDGGAAGQPERIRGRASQAIAGIGGSDVADPDGKGQRQPTISGQEERLWPAVDGTVAPDADSGRWRESLRADAAPGAFPEAIGAQGASGPGPSGPNDGWRWVPEPAVRRVVDGLPGELDRHRLKGLGNAIVPQVAYELMRVMFADEIAQVAA